MTKEEFRQRFVAEMLKANPDDKSDDLRAYAEQTADSYFEEPWQREEGPEECARTDMSYWGDDQ